MIGKILAFAWDRPRALLAVALALGLAGFFLASRCASPAPVATSAVATVSSHSAATTTKKTGRVTTKKVRQVTTRPDGTKVERVEESTTQAGGESRREETAQTDTKTETKSEPRGYALGLGIGAEWSRLSPTPSSVKIDADVAIGKVFGTPLRLGAELRADPGRIGRGDVRGIEAAGIYVRGEFF